MPFSAEWSEELAAEWIAIQGYLIETNVPVGSAGRGGRNEADILGVRIEEGVVKGVHIEVGSYAENPEKTVNRLRKKFDGNSKGVKAWFKVRTGMDIEPRKILITTWASKPVREAIKIYLPDVELITFEELCKEIVTIVDEYVFVKKKLFPDNFWFLNFLHSLRFFKVSLGKN